MRTYLIEDLYPEDLAKIVQRLNALNLAGPLDGIFYLPLPEDLLGEEQRAHLGECGPFILALEAVDEPCSLKLELLVRAQGKLRCSCVTYATAPQREYAMDRLDALIRELDIAV